MATLVTGGTGFLGSYLTRLLVESGERVVAFDRTVDRSRIEDVVDDVTIVEGDVLDLDGLVAALAEHGITHVAHLAGIPGPARPDAIVPYVEVQCMGTANVFEAARRSGIRRVVTASSVAVFGREQAAPVTESSPTAPGNIYGTCKLWAEGLAATFNREHGMEIVSMRIGASMGYGRLTRAWLGEGALTPAGHERLFIAFPEVAALGRPVVMPQDDQLFDLLHASDTALAWQLALRAPTLEHTVFNLRAHRCRMADMTRELRRLLPDADISVSDTPVGVPPLMDNSRLVADLGFEPRFDLVTGLADYVAEVQRRHGTRR